jgi:hypothetical protein
MLICITIVEGYYAKDDHSRTAAGKTILFLSDGDCQTKKSRRYYQRDFSIWCHSVPAFWFGKQNKIPFYQNPSTPDGDTERQDFIKQFVFVSSACAG